MSNEFKAYRSMDQWNETFLNNPYAIRTVVYDPMALDINGDPFPQVNAQVSLQCLRDGAKITIPITQASLVLLPSPQQRELEAQAAKDAQEIKSLKSQVTGKDAVIQDADQIIKDKNAEIKSLWAKLGVAGRVSDDWHKHSDKQAAEIKRLETVCTSHWYARNDAECKWTETVGELDNTKNQLKEVRVANGKLLDTKHELEKHARGLETIVASQGRRIKELETTGSSKERDEYSKALEQLRAAKDAQISQITKQAGEWKQTATTRAKEIDRLAELVLERTKERDALQAEKGLCPCKPSKKLDPWGTPFWADYPLTYHSYHSSGFRYAGTASQAPKQTVAETLSLNTRVTAVEARVTKLEEAEGFPMESCTVADFQDILAYMGGQWVKARKSGGQYFSVRTPDFNKEREWDLANQPTRWKPMPGNPSPDPMPGYYILDKSTQVEEGDEFEISPGVWIPSGNWSTCNKSQGKAHRYRRKIK